MKSIAKKLLLAFVVINMLVIFARSEYASALVDLEPLLNTKGKIVETLDKYIQAEVQRLDKIRRLTQVYDELYKTALKNEDQFLSNPINSYLLVKRLTTDWKFVQNLVEGIESKVIVYEMVEEEILPNDYDLEEAANAVIRLQETYLLNTTDLVKGEVAGLKGATELTASDCFELGLNAYNESNFDLAVLWFQESMDRLNKDDFQMVDKTDLLDYFSYSAFMIEDIELALQLTKDIIKINPRHPKVYSNLRFYKNELLKKEKESKDPKTKNYTEINKEELQEGEIDPTLYDLERYKKLCRGEQLRTPAQERKLKCRYTSNGSKYMLLQPVKEETLNLDPWIVAYHDVIRDPDIEILKEMSEHIPEESDIFDQFGIGNRIATWLFYLSDVEAGGSTVFPEIGVQIKPIKGSAGFWYNLFKNGEGDLRTKHAACPVIAGKKWVANKWLHERGQEFRRPCDLNPLA